jgi:hypothetical protein
LIPGDYIAVLNGEKDWIIMDFEIGFNARIVHFYTFLMARQTFEVGGRFNAGNV